MARRVLGGLVTILCVLLLLAGLGGMLLRSKASQFVPALRGMQPMVVLSGSMEPSIQVGSLVFVKKVDPATIKQGDVITFLVPPQSASAESAITTHRVMEVSNTSGQTAFKTKGDANNAEDAWAIRQEDVIGAVTFSLPYAGYLSAFSRSRPGFALLILLPAAILISIEVRDIAREVRERRRFAYLENEEAS